MIKNSMAWMMEGLDKNCPNCGKPTSACSGFKQEMLKWMREGYKFRDAYKKALEEILDCDATVDAS